MSVKQPVFFVSNTSRKEEFLIETRIWKKSGILEVEKRAVTEKSWPHLNNMVTTYRKLTAIPRLTKLANIIEPLPSKPGMLDFKHVGGMSAERALLERILASDEAGSFEILDRLFDIIDSLPTRKVNPTEDPAYIEVFGNSFSKIQPCTEVGIIDLNLDNAIIDNSGLWHIYDYEWVFGFPIPKDFLRIRLLWYFLSRHKEVLRYHSQRTETVCINKDIYIPSHLYVRYEKLFKLLSDLRTAENHFQLYVTGREAHSLSATDTKSLLVEESNLIDVGIEETVRALTSDIRKELQEERKKKRIAENKLDAILSSKQYKIAQKMASVKNRLIKR